MPKYDLKLKTTDAGTQKARTLTLSNVNPEASPVTLKQFTQKLNLLTNNTYVETDYIVTTNLDTETPPIDTRQEPTVTINNTSGFPSNPGEAWWPYTTNSDGVVSIAIEGNRTYRVGLGQNEQQGNYFAIYLPSAQTTTGGQITIRIEGTENFKPFEQTYDIT